MKEKRQCSIKWAALAVAILAFGIARANADLSWELTCAVDGLVSIWWTAVV